MDTELVGNRLPRGTNQLGFNCWGPNVHGPYMFGTKCVTANLWQTKYVLAVPKNFRVGVDFQPCRAGDFLAWGVRSPCVDHIPMHLLHENFIIILTLKHITIIWVVRAALNWRTKGSSCSSPTTISWSRWLWSWPPSRVATMNPWSLKPPTEKLEVYDRELPLVNCKNNV